MGRRRHGPIRLVVHFNVYEMSGEEPRLIDRFRRIATVTARRGYPPSHENAFAYRVKFRGKVHRLIGKPPGQFAIFID